jgi:hypothetical protein
MKITLDPDLKIQTIYLESKSFLNKVKRKLSYYGWPCYWDKEVLIRSENIKINTDWKVQVKLSFCQLQPLSKVVIDWFSKPYSRQIALELQRRLDKK